MILKQTVIGYTLKIERNISSNPVRLAWLDIEIKKKLQIRTMFIVIWTYTYNYLIHRSLIIKQIYTHHA